MYNFETPKFFRKALLQPFLYLMEAMGSLNQYGFTHSCAEEHLENKLK